MSIVGVSKTVNAYTRQPLDDYLALLGAFWIYQIPILESSMNALLGFLMDLVFHCHQHPHHRVMNDEYLKVFTFLPNLI